MVILNDAFMSINTNNNDELDSEFELLFKHRKSYGVELDKFDLVDVMRQF